MYDYISDVYIDYFFGSILLLIAIFLTLALIFKFIYKENLKETDERIGSSIYVCLLFISFLVFMFYIAYKGIVEAKSHFKLEEMGYRVVEVYPIFRSKNHIEKNSCNNYEQIFFFDSDGKETDDYDDTTFIACKSNQFEIERRFVFYNSITGDHILSLEGRCSIENLKNSVEVTCKTGDKQYKKHHLGLSDNVTHSVE